MNKQYRKERLKLTALYLGIILLIVTLFSVIVINTQNQQFRRFNRQPRIEQGENDLPHAQVYEPSAEERARVDAIVSQIQRDNTRTIIFLDIAILLLSSILSYYLAGKTMQPILETLDKQCRFVSDASHELKTPLTNIMTEAEVLYRDKHTTNEEFRFFAKNIISDVKHLDNLVVSLLQTAKIDNHAVQFDKREVNLVEFTKNAAERFRKRAQKKNLLIEVHSAIENVTKLTDPDLLRRIIDILIDNAIKYNIPGGSIDVFVTNEGMIKVKDTGVGISQENQPKIFDRFFRESEDRNQKGFGLGLSIAKQIADLLKIKISVESTMGKGAVFTLQLP